MINRDSTLGTILVIIPLCFVCALLVCLAVVLLQPLQAEQIVVDRSKSILAAANIEVANKDVTKTFNERIEARLLDLASGDFLSKEEALKITNGAPIDGYNFQSAAKLPDSSIQIPEDQDVAKIKTRAKYMPVYLVKNVTGNYTSVILPFYGQGLWSTMYGYLSLSTDGNTIAGVKYYSHGETPGLGAEIENPIFTAKWVGKKLADDNGNVLFNVTKKVSDPAYEIDALSGATLTSNGVANSIKYWADSNGYGPFLKKIKAEGVK